MYKKGITVYKKGRTMHKKDKKDESVKEKKRVKV